MEGTKRKFFTSRGIMIELNRQNGESFIRTDDDNVPLTRAETILWYAAHFNVTNENNLVDYYYRTLFDMGIQEPEVTEVFKSLYDKRCIVFGSAEHKQDALYRMLCGGMLTASANAGYKGNNTTKYDASITFDPVRCGVSVDVAPCDWERTNHLAMMIANERWVVSEIVRNIDEGYPTTITRTEALRKELEYKPKVIELYPKPDSVKDIYYQTKLGREVATNIAKLIIAQRVFLI